MVPQRRTPREDIVEEPLVNLNARVPKELWRRVRLQCLREGRLLRSFITDALREHLKAKTAGR